MTLCCEDCTELQQHSNLYLLDANSISTAVTQMSLGEISRCAGGSANVPQLRSTRCASKHTERVGLCELLLTTTVHVRERQCRKAWEGRNLSSHMRHTWLDQDGREAGVGMESAVGNNDRTNFSEFPLSWPLSTKVTSLSSPESQ